MTAIGSINPALSPVASAADETTAAPATPPAPTADAAKTLHAQKEAAQKFESIFLRQMLSSLEKTNKMGQSSGKGDGSGGIYGSMMVGSLADSISQSGGIGLADVILRALQGPPTGAPTGAPKK